MVHGARDRPEANLGTGIVMGTSLSGLGRRISLAGRLSGADAAYVLAEVRELDSSA